MVICDSHFWLPEPQFARCNMVARRHRIVHGTAIHNRLHPRRPRAVPLLQAPERPRHRAVTQRRPVHTARPPNPTPSPSSSSTWPATCALRGPIFTSDGEKPDRHRDTEFETPPPTRSALVALWEAGWKSASMRWTGSVTMTCPAPSPFAPSLILSCKPSIARSATTPITSAKLCFSPSILPETDAEEEIRRMQPQSSRRQAFTEIARCVFASPSPRNPLGFSSDAHSV